ncbi:uncharacterized protein SPPG_06918 [Spizellomyces punctatus DAOM BR117]|uniref:Calcineurin-like phosphoesterase domain-containing protein n=1 Tax=Spizellomyces punctatus (strain DAOM BR117) TaxID=645134 RepID=A0A0L0HB30_SPIPD|nr:uncharacterized protein SPPG_06918 [Spizellomyces punctatus DAOM BR117]KNC97928.1 hypothetical protein SPPG_06918 [Spizellomyces punctatus DAOM BR117]|eukprot:XP_016605968.1 hypothetical protein SPPG_06918 [Spizellomyces punctatus DAOM BR117]
MSSDFYEAQRLKRRRSAGMRPKTRNMYRAFLSVSRNLIRLSIYNPFVLLWIVNVFVCEVWLSRAYIGRCSWPASDQDGANPIRVVVIADPQLTDAYSYSQSGLGLALTQFYSDLYMKRNFKVLQSKLEPDVVVFLGDIMDGGREWADDQVFEEELQRVRRVFWIRSPKTRVLWVAGNHDIGFGNKVLPDAYARFRKTFGEPNYAVDLANFTVVALDTVSLSGTPGPIHYDKARTFLDSFKDPSQKSRVLLTHIPLFRSHDAGCGPGRRHPVIHQGAGYQYQNLVVETLSEEILTKIRPSIVLSGDDHDWCEYTHRVGGVESIEHTIATFSWMQGNHYPGFALLTLPQAGSPTLQACTLAPQLRIYIWYIFLAILTFLLLIPYSAYQIRRKSVSYVEIPLFGYNQLSGLPRRRSNVGERWKVDARTWRLVGRFVGEVLGMSLGMYMLFIMWDWTV